MDSHRADIGELRHEMQLGFERVDARFQQFDARFEGRLVGLDGKLASLYARIYWR